MTQAGLHVCMCMRRDGEDILQAAQRIVSAWTQCTQDLTRLQWVTHPHAWEGRYAGWAPVSLASFNNLLMFTATCCIVGPLHQVITLHAATHVLARRSLTAIASHKLLAVLQI